MAYKFLNLQPLGERKEDCVCRAISLATGLNYYIIEEKLYLIGELFNCEKLCVCCYKHLLDYVFGYERVNGYKGFTINDFIKENPEGTYIIRVDGHLTCVTNGLILDTWDCGECLIDIIWEVLE